MIDFNFENKTRVDVSRDLFLGLLRKFEKALNERIESYLGNQKGEINLALVDDAKIEKLNIAYRKKSGPTDVISFAYLEEDFPNEKDMDSAIGDIFISVDTAARQAKEYGHDLEKELSILFVHGLLHLFGFDHNDDEEENEMEKWAKEILI